MVCEGRERYQIIKERKKGSCAGLGQAAEGKKQKERY